MRPSSSTKGDGDVLSGAKNLGTRDKFCCLRRTDTSEDFSTVLAEAREGFAKCFQPHWDVRVTTLRFFGYHEWSFHFRTVFKRIIAFIHT
jgi:hypothetical protein